MAETWQIEKELWAAAEIGGLDPGACTVNLTPRRRWIRLTHPRTRSFAELRPASDGKWVFCEGTGKGLQALRRPAKAVVVSRDEALSLVTMWAASVAGQSLGSTREYRRLDNSPFSAAEQREIAARLAEIAAQVRGRADLSDKQMARIEAKLDELADASKRVGRKDWLIMVYSAALGLVASDLIPAHVVHGIITAVISGLGHLLGIGTVPPVIGS